MTPLPFLHSNHPFTWTAWHAEPTLVAGVVIALGLYFLRLQSLSSKGAGDRPSLLRISSYLAGVVFVFVALGSPLDVGAGRLFSLHMLQHVILSTWAPPLILMGLTAGVLAPLLQCQPSRMAIRLLAHPFVGAPLFIVNMWVWHVPFVYDVAVTYEGVHWLMHLSFLGSGLLFWWTVVPPIRELHPLSTPWRMFYVFVTGFPMMLLAFVLVATQSVLYEYYETQPRLWGLSPLDDQQIGGAIMGTLGEFTMVIPFTIFFVRLMSGDDGEQTSTPEGQHVAGQEAGQALQDSARSGRHV